MAGGKSHLLCEFSDCDYLGPSNKPRLAVFLWAAYDSRREYSRSVKVWTSSLWKRAKSVVTVSEDLPALVTGFAVFAGHCSWNGDTSVLPRGSGSAFANSPVQSPGGGALVLSTAYQRPRCKLNANKLTALSTASVLFSKDPFYKIQFVITATSVVILIHFICFYLQIIYFSIYRAIGSFQRIGLNQEIQNSFNQEDKNLSSGQDTHWMPEQKWLMIHTGFSWNSSSDLSWSHSSSP